MQPPVHPALAMASHEKFAWTLQLPLQLAWHWPLQLADGPMPLQLTSHWSVQLAMHWLMQFVFDPIDEHWLVQLPWQDEEQLPEQLKLPGLAEHWPMHVPSHPPVQLALADPEHIACTLAVQLTGVHAVSQPPDVSSWHDRLVAPEKSSPPHAATGAAWAVLGATKTKAAATAPARADKNVR
jgi:hypothetical protein